MRAKQLLCVVLMLATLLALIVLPTSAAAPQGLELFNGASIRFEGTQGLRFVGRIAKSGSIVLTAGGENANFGILLIPQSALGANVTIDKDTANVLQVPAKALMNQDSVQEAGLVYDANYYYFSAVQTGIPVEFYATDWVARAYVNDNGNYSYSEQVKRSIKTVAEAIIADSKASAGLKTAANTVISDYNHNDGAVPVDFSNLGTLVKYPDYPEEITKDSLYSVTVTQGQKSLPLSVYNQATGYSHFDKDSSTTRVLSAMDSNRRFCEFAFANVGVIVKIKVNKSFNTYVVSPTSKKFSTSYSNGVISVTLSQPEYFVLILDNDYNTALSVFADAPETSVPTKGSSNLVYVEGNNQITDPSGLITYSGDNNEVMTVSKNYANIYIAPGAVLKKRIVLKETGTDGYNAQQIKIYGRGIILDPYSDIANSNQNNIPSDAATTTVILGGYNDKMEDVKVVNSTNFNVKFTGSDGYANHVKLLSTEMSTDGFTTTALDYTQDDKKGLIENCFVYVGDNALVIQNNTSTSGYTFKNITIGTTCAAIYPQWNANTTLTDIYVFRADDGLINVYESGVGAQTVNITNLDALDCVKIPTLFNAKNAPGTSTKTFNLTNVVMRYTTGSNGNFTPGTNTANRTSVSNTNSSSSGYVLNLTNLYMGGQKVDGATNKLQINSGVYTSSSNYSANGVTINFASDNNNLPECRSVPTNNTANYTYNGAAVYGPERDWTRYQAYKCNVTKSGSAYTVTSTQSSSTTWGLSKDITNLVRQNGTGSYRLTLTTNTSVEVYVVKCSATNGTTTQLANTSVSGTNKTVTFSVDDLTAIYQIVVKSKSTSGSVTLSNPSVTKN